MNQWACIGHNPTQWAFGDIKPTGEMINITAIVTRQKNGKWLWVVKTDDIEDHGIEPSRLLSIDTANKLISQ